MTPQQAFYTYRGDLRPFGNGTPVHYRYDASAFTTDPLGEPVIGEMAAFDATNNRVLRWNRTGANGKFIGIIRDSAAGLKSLGNQAALTPASLGVFTTGIHEMVGTVGDTYNHGDAVYMNGTDTVKVQKTAAGGVQVGTVHNPRNDTIVGAVRVPVLIDEFTVTQR